MKFLKILEKLICWILILSIGLPYNVAKASGQRSGSKESAPSAQRSSKTSVSKATGNRSSSSKEKEILENKNNKGLTTVGAYTESAATYTRYAGAQNLAQERILARIEETDKTIFALSEKAVQMLSLDPSGVINDIAEPQVTELSPLAFEKYMKKIEQERMAAMLKEKVSSKFDSSEVFACLNQEFNYRSVASSEDTLSPNYGYDQNNDDPDNINNQDDEKEKKKEFLGLSKKTWGWITSIGGVAVGGLSLMMMLNCMKKRNKNKGDTSSDGGYPTSKDLGPVTVPPAGAPEVTPVEAEESATGASLNFSNSKSLIANYQSSIDPTFLFRSQAAAKEKSTGQCMIWLAGVVAGVALVFVGLKMIKKQKKEDEESLAKIDAAKNLNLLYAREHQGDERDGNGSDVEADESEDSDSNDFVDDRTYDKTDSNNSKISKNKATVSKTSSYVKLGKTYFTKPVANSIKKYAKEYGVDSHKMANALVAKNTEAELSKLIGDPEEINFVRSKAGDGMSAHVLANTYKKFGGYEGVDRAYQRILASPAWTNKERENLKNDENLVVQAASASSFREPTGSSYLADTSSSVKSASSAVLGSMPSRRNLTDQRVSETNKSESLFDRVRKKLEETLRK